MKSTITFLSTRVSNFAIKIFFKRALFSFWRLLYVLLTDLKNIWHNCNNGNLQQITLFKFYIDAWYLIVTQTEYTASTATVDINITQQNPTLKFEMNAKHSKWRSDQVFKISSTSFTQRRQWKIWNSLRINVVISARSRFRPLALRLLVLLVCQWFLNSLNLFRPESVQPLLENFLTSF